MMRDQGMSSASPLAPTGTLRVGVWTVPFFAQRHRDDTRDSALHGLIPDVANELARRAGVPVTMSGYGAPHGLLDAFRAGLLDVTFVGMTADRATMIDFGPVVFEIETTYLVPPSSKLTSIADVDRPGGRIAVPSPSAQEGHLKHIITRATLVPVAPENPQAALDLLAAGKADAFSHVAPMLASVRERLPGSRLLPGSYYNVPIAIGIARGRPSTAMEIARAFVQDMKASGFLHGAIVRSGASGIVVAD